MTAAPVRLARGSVGMICRTVDRCHVGESDAAVILYAVGCLRTGVWSTLPAPMQRRFCRVALACHARNRDLYGFAMGGCR